MVVVLLGDRDITSVINDGGSRRLVEIIVGAIIKRNKNFGTSAEIQWRFSKNLVDFHRRFSGVHNN